MGVTTVATKAIFAGGCRPIPCIPYGTVDTYDDAAGVWPRDTLSEARFGLAATAVGTTTVFAGGLNRNTIDMQGASIGTVYCSPAVANSTGFHATLEAQGAPGSAAQGNAVLSSTGLPPHSFGMFLASRSQGSVASPGGSQGHLCLGGSIGRFNDPSQVVGSGPSGRFQLCLDLTQLPQPMGTASVQSGETWNFQAWYRDANPTPTSNFTSAISVTFH